MKAEPILESRSYPFVVLVILLSLVSFTQAQTFNVVYNFTGGNDGGDSTAGLLNVSGEFYGTTTQGGEDGYGVVFRISPTGHESAIHSFTGGPDGATPQSGLIDFGDNLYGTASAGGTSGAGTVFEVTLEGKLRVLYSFTGGVDGAGPQGGLTVDSRGNLYGTTFSGGANGNGTVFELVRPNVTQGRWTEKVLYSFGTGTDGANPMAGVTFGKAGDLYGTTSAGGAYTYGTVFQLLPSDSGWEENLLYQFQLQSDGGIPYAGITMDASGNLYGATTDGGAGGSNGGGTVFEISSSASDWSFEVLYSLAGWGISGTERAILLKDGNIFATTHCDGTDDAGTIYELSPSGSGWTYTQFYSFTGGTDGLYSVSTPVFDKEGNLWGTTRYGGANNWGVVFKIQP